MPMTLREALEPVCRHRGEAVVIETMSAISLWPQLSNSELDFAYMPSAMGQAPTLGLGIALSKPGQRVIVLNGDGSMLMNLGSLVTLANHPANVYLVTLDNGIYEITGGQETAGTGHTDFAGMARAAGIKRVYTFDTAETWQQGSAEALTGSGPVFIWLKVIGQLGQKTPRPPRPMAQQIESLRKALK